jgi:predicted nucleic acid-binding protein
MPEDSWYFDTVSLCNFFLSDAEKVLENRYRKQAYITGEVYNEICAGFVKYPVLKKIETLLSRKIFSLVSLSVDDRRLYSSLIACLGRGEASCIAAANQTGASNSRKIVVTDDRAARKQCHQLHIPFTGTIGILKASVSEGRLSPDQADIYLDRMIRQGFYSPVRSISEITGLL